jgi:hypothetical protein
VRRANGDAVCAPHPKVIKDPGTRVPWVRPTSPPVAPSGQRAADVRARVLMLRALGHWKTSSVHASEPRDARYLDPQEPQEQQRGPEIARIS